MARTSNAGRGHADLSWVRLRIGDELGNAFGRHRWSDHHHAWFTANARDWCDVAEEIEIELFIEGRVNRVGRADQEERVAVRGGANDRLSANIAARARPVLDDEWLTETLGKPLTHQARSHVGSATRRKADNQA